MPSYFANIGPTRGPVRFGNFPYAIGVLESRGNNMPVGMAFEAGRTDGGLAVWRLVVDGAEVPGLFVIVDREFRPVGWTRLPTAPSAGKLVMLGRPSGRGCRPGRSLAVRASRSRRVHGSPSGARFRCDSPRMTTRRWMIAEAILGLMMGGSVGGYRLKRRRDHFLGLAQYHGVRADGDGHFLPSRRATGGDPASEESYARHIRLARKYERAARYPWLAVELDPPEP